MKNIKSMNYNEFLQKSKAGNGYIAVASVPSLMGPGKFDVLAKLTDEGESISVTSLNTNISHGKYSRTALNVETGYKGLVLDIMRNVMEVGKYIFAEVRNDGDTRMIIKRFDDHYIPNYSISDMFCITNRQNDLKAGVYLSKIINFKTDDNDNPILIAEAVKRMPEDIYGSKTHDLSGTWYDNRIIEYICKADKMSWWYRNHVKCAPSVNTHAVEKDYGTPDDILYRFLKKGDIDSLGIKLSMDKLHPLNILYFNISNANSNKFPLVEKRAKTIKNIEEWVRKLLSTHDNQLGNEQATIDLVIEGKIDSTGVMGIMETVLTSYEEAKEEAKAKKAAERKAKRLEKKAASSTDDQDVLAELA